MSRKRTIGDQSWTQQPRKVRFFITGFGPFASVAENPSQRVAEALLHSSSVCASSIVHVSLAGADAAVELHLDCLQGICNPQDSVFLIHFGVAKDTEAVKLESASYNELAASIPDNSGNLFTGQVIDPAFGDQKMSRKTTINLDALLKRLPASLRVELSDDPGRYLCNYIYFRSLSKLSELDGQFSKLTSLFIHVPPLTNMSQEEINETCAEILRSIAELDIDENRSKL